MFGESRILLVNRPVLVVGDLGATALAITQALRALGWREVARATDVESAIERLRSHEYGLVLSDSNSKLLDGFALLRAVRRDPVTASIPFIFVSGEQSAKFRNRARRAAATGYVLKTFSLRELIDSLRHILSAPRGGGVSIPSRMSSLKAAEEVIFGPETHPLH